jgi:N-acetylmuramoyl-L-alanine amidase
MRSLKILITLILIIVTNIAFCQETFKVVVDAGHGGKDPGNTGNGFLEKKIALNIALKLGKNLEQNNIDVIYTRKSDVFVDLFDRANLANKSDAQLFISIHCDSHTSQAFGAGTFVLGLHANQRNFEVAKKENSVIFYEDDYDTRYEGFDPNNPESVIGLTLMQEEYLDQSILAASYIQNSFVDKLNRKNRTVKQAGFIVLKYTYMPSVLVETGFLTNKSEGMYLNSDKGQTEMADAISSAIIEYKDNFYKNLLTDNSSFEQQGDIISYRVQIAASNKLLELKPYNFKGLNSVNVIKQGELYKYFYGIYNSFDKAEIALEQAKRNGFNSSFIVRFKNNLPLSIN